MLVTFSCSAYANIIMFGDIAVQLIKMMGHSGTVPGAILSDDVSSALERLQSNLAKMQEQFKKENVDENDDAEPVISIAHRALPLIELLQAAIQDKSNVMWE